MNAENNVVGQIISGNVSKIFIRIKNNSEVDVGDILICEEKNAKYYIKIIDLNISSQLENQFIEEIAGNNLEYEEDSMLFDEKDRFYKIGCGKILKIQTLGFHPPRNLPKHFSKVRRVKEKDFEFLKENKGVEIGNLRLGMKSLENIKVKLPSNELVSHHMLVVAATGRGKSNFAKVFIKGLMEIPEVSSIIIDPHGEYYGGRGIIGLSHHPNRKNLRFFTPRFTEYPESEELRIHAQDLEPNDFFGIVDLSGAQKEAMQLFYRKFKEEWLSNMLKMDIQSLEKMSEGRVMRSTIFTLKRKLNNSLELNDGEGIVFSLKKREGTSIFSKIQKAVCEGNIIIIDTNLVGDEAEKIISSSITTRIFNYYRKEKQANPKRFNTLPELLIVFEEAPRVLGIDALAKGTNIFERITREGRKFKVGVCAITQMPSLLPKEILSQMNTKVILGLPAPSDREAVINSSTQNISDESVEIQMLDRGEALITSPFLEFPLPVKIHYFNDLIKKSRKEKTMIFGFG